MRIVQIDGLEHRVGVVDLIRHHLAGLLRQGGQQVGHEQAIGLLAGRQVEVDAVAERIDDGVDFGRVTTPTAAEALARGRTFFGWPRPGGL